MSPCRITQVFILFFYFISFNKILFFNYFSFHFILFYLIKYYFLIIFYFILFLFVHRGLNKYLVFLCIEFFSLNSKKMRNVGGFLKIHKYFSFKFRKIVKSMTKCITIIMKKIGNDFLKLAFVTLMSENRIRARFTENKLQANIGS